MPSNGSKYKKNVYANEILKLGLSKTNIIHPNVKIQKIQQLVGKYNI